jgi:uncharacterized protein (DUF488 family)
MPDIFTIGYEGLLQPQLLDLLAANKIHTVLDVRAIPLSRKAGFSKNVLAASLATKNIAYINDKRLGTPKPGRDAARKGHTPEMVRIFETHMQTHPAQDALSDAITLSTTHPTCLLCFEREPHTCHRSILAALIRERTGQPIRHL